MRDINDMLKNLDANQLQAMLNSPRGQEIANQVRGMGKEQAAAVLAQKYGVSAQELQQLANHPEVANLLRGLN